jgi:hypothetical protein
MKDDYKNLKIGDTIYIAYKGSTVPDQEEYIVEALKERQYGYELSVRRTNDNYSRLMYTDSINDKKLFLSLKDVYHYKREIALANKAYLESELLKAQDLVVEWTGKLRRLGE